MYLLFLGKKYSLMNYGVNGKHCLTSTDFEAKYTRAPDRKCDAMVTSMTQPGFVGFSGYVGNGATTYGSIYESFC